MSATHCDASPAVRPPAPPGLSSGLRWYNILPALVLVGAIVVQIVQPGGRPPPTRSAHLAAAIPHSVPGEWVVRDLPLGPNEFVAAAAQQILRTDDFVHREYRRGRVILTVYAAYWGAGKMPIRQVSSHTPDRCWTENGMQCREMRFKESTRVEGRALQPAEWRRFEDPRGRMTFVRFWHLIEGRAYDFGERFNAVPDPVQWWGDVVQQAVRGSPEQYFIRVASNVPLEEIWNEAGVQAVLAGLVGLGLGDAAMAGGDAVAPSGPVGGAPRHPEDGAS